ncbi:hypothetical protein [Streptomyces pakalii]|uniref:ATP-binding protein n=1 Tax=Streptomyces pakalii TaxID=3036494 RepID=A0ABT7DAA0_9ACTN|nr:hypothetical protein [Streptomyces pakalii]MDJ1642483.1 hypothetical protein [Streptomyces pakalii]
MSGGDSPDEPQPRRPASLDGQSGGQNNRADAGSTIYAVQNGDQYFVGPDGRLLFAQWERRLLRSPHALSVEPDVEITIDRKAVAEHLSSRVGRSRLGQVVVVRGEPGVGKTALVSRSIGVVRDPALRVLAATARAMAPYAGGLEELIRAAVGQDGSPERLAPAGFLFLDGAEAAQEGLEDLVAEAVEASMAAGLVPVLVSRDDAMDTLRDLLSRAGHREIEEIVIPPLDDGEIAEVLTSAPQLARIADDERSRWLLRRIGLIDLLLRSAGRGIALPRALASEADVYKHVWLAFVLNGGRAVDGVAFEDRGQAMVSLAEGRLTGSRSPSVPGPALASLRSDGILASLDELSATSNEEHRFAHDILRDFATARRLLLDSGFPLLDADGPRWAVRASRIYCQVKLQPGTDVLRDFRTRWNRTYQQFARLAELHGARWEEIPWEAALSAGWCADALAALTGQLTGEPDLLNGLLRCTMLRFSDGSACDPLVAAPVVEWLARHTKIFSQRPDHPGDKVVLAWLRGVSRQEALGADVARWRTVRALVREAMLGEVPEYPSAAFVEALALLGSDRDDAAGDMLMELARKRPLSLMPTVDRAEAGRCLAVTDPALLVKLATAYYLMLPRRRPEFDADRWRRRRTAEHEFLGSAHGSRARWWRGPFFALLQADPALGMRLIGLVVRGTVESHGNRDRDRDRLREENADEGNGPGEHDLNGDFLGTGLRGYSGAEESWSWYGGALSGPQPCMSALMALDRWLELEIVRPGVAPLREAAGLVLTRVGTLAGLGLAHGMLLRHLDSVTDELDDFLAHPEIWALEHGRVVNHTLFGKGSELPGNAWLLQQPVKIAMSLVIEAVHRKDTEAVSRLRTVADRLRGAAPEGIDGLEVKAWADHLDWDRFTLDRQDAHVEVGVLPSPDIHQELDRRRARSGRSSKQYELLNRYALRRTMPHRVSDPVVTDPERLADDLQAARDICAGLGGDERMLDGVYAVAAAAVHAATAGQSLSAEQLRWSVDLLAAAVQDPVDLFHGPGAILPMSGNRLAALALPRLLLPVIAASVPALLGAERTVRVHTAVVRGAAHPLHEVREYTVEGLRPLWAVPCSAGDGECHHIIAWSAVEALVSAAVGEQHGDVSRPRVTARELDRLSGEELVPEPVAIAAPAVLDAARTAHCRSDRAVELRQPLLDAHARAACAWGYESHTERHAALAVSLLRASITEPALLPGVADRLAGSPSALSHLLRGLKIAATYERDLASPLAVSWPYLMESALTQPPPVRSGHHDSHILQHDHEILMGELVPNPVLSMADKDMDGTLREARSRWLHLPCVAEQVEDWTTMAGKGWSAVDNLIGFLKAQPVHEQVDPGLRWVRQLCVNSSGRVDSAGLALADWLRELHPEVTTSARTHFQAVVDALALAQHPAASALQGLDE